MRKFKLYLKARPETPVTITLEDSHPEIEALLHKLAELSSNGKGGGMLLSMARRALPIPDVLKLTEVRCSDDSAPTS